MRGWGEEELAALGKIVLNFAALDTLAGVMVEGFLEERQVASVLVAGEPTLWKLEKLSVLAGELLHEPYRQSVLDWTKGMRVINERRNQLLHSLYVVSHEEQSSMARLKASTRGGKWRAHSEQVALGQLQELVELMAEGITTGQVVVATLPESQDWHGR